MLRGRGLSRLVRRQGKALGWWSTAQEGVSTNVFPQDPPRTYRTDRTNGAMDSSLLTRRESEQVSDSQMGRFGSIARGFAQEAPSKRGQRDSERREAYEQPARSGDCSSSDQPLGAESSARFESVDSSKSKNASSIGESSQARDTAKSTQFVSSKQAFSSKQEAGEQTPPREDAEVQPEILSRPEPDILSYVGELFAQAKLSFAIMVLRRSVETGFDLEDFKKGAEVAFRAFMEYYPKGDFETLKNMVSPNLLKNLQGVWEEFKREGKVMECTLEELRGIQVTGMDFFMRRPPLFDGLPQVTDYNENQWLKVSVRFNSTERYRLRSPEGKLKQHMLDKRGHVLQFVRQLPGWEKGPIQELESPWYIVNV